MSYKLIWALLAVSYIVACSAQKDTETRFWEYQNAGDKAYIEGNYAEAEKQYTAALALAEEKGPENNLMIPGLHSLAKVYSAQKKDAQAEELLRRRLAIAEKADLEDPQYLAIIHDDLVLFYLLRNKYAEAEPLYRRALLIRENAFGPNDSRVVKSLEFYATLLRNINRYDEATELEMRANLIKSNSSNIPHS